MEVEIKNRRNISKRILEAILNGKNVVFQGRYIVNNIGATAYIDYNFLRSMSIEEIENILY